MKLLWKNYSYIIIFIVLLLFIGLYTIVSLERYNKNYETYEVTENQSLWDIAESYHYSEEKEVVAFIEKVQKKNHLQTTYINKGEKILVPAKTETITSSSKQLALKTK